ncbi:MAG: type IV pilus twitching motility protein PilT [Gemmatimonadota bacterium]
MPNKDRNEPARLLEALADANASDLILVPGRRPQFRLDGELFETELNPPLTAAETAAMAEQLVPASQRRRFELDTEADFAIEDETSRFRVSAYKERGNVALSIRRIPRVVPHLELLELPPALAELMDQPNGMILVTGPVGSGKTTTLAAMLDYMNRRRRKHVLTIEDPIEFVHEPDLCTFSQREVGEDTPSFKSALRHALRHNPDIILIGEMRDLETTATALTVAETGHLTLATLHTPSAVGSITRIIDMCPVDQQEQVRTQLSFVLQAVVAQTLVPRKEGGGRIAACEILMATPAVRTAIREDKLHQIQSLIQTGSTEGMLTLDQHLVQLYQASKISLEVCVKYARDMDAVLQLINVPGTARAEGASPALPAAWPRRTDQQTAQY